MTHSVSDKHMLRSSVIVSVLQAVGVLVAYLREMAVARQFGSHSQVDHYYVAFTIVTFLPTIAWNVGWAAFVPIFMQRWLFDRDRAWRLANLALTYLLLISLAGCVAAVAFDRTWIRIVAPGFSSGAMNATRHLTFILLPVLLFMGINVQLMAILNGLKLFRIPTLSQALPSLFSLFAVLGAPARVGIASLAWGWTIGTLAQTLVLLSQCWGTGYRFRPCLGLCPDLRELAANSLSYVLPACSYLTMVLVDRHYASQIGTGAIAVLNYGDKIFRIPMLVLTTSLFTVSLSYFAEHTAAEDFVKFRETLSVGLRFAAFLLLPTGLLMLILREPIACIAYQRGAFSFEDTRRVSATLVFFAPLVVVHGLWYVLERSMVALGRMRLLTGISILAIAMKIGTSAIVYRRLGVPGLVLATALTFCVAAIIMYGVILRRFGASTAFSEVAGIGHLLPAIACSALVGLAIRSVLTRNGFTPGNVPNSFLLLGTVGGGALIAFLGIASLMRTPELMLMGRWLHARILRQTEAA
jgi:putative peptidoglycan lipid II flippase